MFSVVEDGPSNETRVHGPELQKAAAVLTLKNESTARRSGTPSVKLSMSGRILNYRSCFLDTKK